jgi:hypothetical protein
MRIRIAFSPNIMTTNKELEKNVERGIKWLNKRPTMSGWHNKIDVETLDISHPNRCIAGQLKLWNDETVRKLDTAISLGMMLPRDREWMEGNDILTSMWRKRILELRNQNK